MSDTELTVTVVTNNHPRDLACWYDLPAEAQPDFDYIEGEDRYTLRLFKYRGAWYDTGEFSPCGESPAYRELGEWHAVQSYTYFSGTVIRYCDDFERVIAGRYFS